MSGHAGVPGTDDGDHRTCLSVPADSARGIEALLGAADEAAPAPEPTTIYDTPGESAGASSGRAAGDADAADGPDAPPVKQSVSQAAPPPERSRPDGTGEAEIPTVTVPLDRIDANPYQPRRDFGEAELEALAESLTTHKMLQPILVRPGVGGRFELISGERRLRAAQKAGWTEIPAQVREADDRLVAELAIVENVQRKDLDPIEKAACFRRYIDEHGCTQEELARRISLDRATVANMMRLLDLPDAVQDHVRQGRITAGHARTLLRLGEEEEQLAFSRRIQDESLTVRAAEHLIAEIVEADNGGGSAVIAGRIGDRAGENRNSPGRGAATSQKPQLAALAAEFRTALGTRVDVSLSAKHRGKIVIHFKNDAEFERLRAYLLGEEAATGTQ